MKKTIVTLSISVFLFVLPSTAQTTSVKERTSKATVQAFFTAFGKGDFNGILDTFSEDAKIIAIRDGKRKENEIFGTYHGVDGVKSFISNLGNAFDTQDFQVHHLIEEGEVAFAKGSFVHKIKATGKLFESDWALLCIVKEGKITTYQFFEDSAAFVNVNQ